MLYRSGEASGGAHAVPAGGIDSLIGSLRAAATAAGAQVRCGAPVRRILVGARDADATGNGSRPASGGLVVNGVELENGERIDTDCVVSSAEGFTYSNCSYMCSMMRQAIHRDLNLSRHGLILVPYLGTVNFGDGDELSARIIVSNLDAKRTFTHIMDASDLPDGIRENVGRDLLRSGIASPQSRGSLHQSGQALLGPSPRPRHPCARLLTLD